MVFFPKNSSLVGLDLTKQSLKSATLRPHKAGWVIDSLEETSVDQINGSQKEFKNSLVISNLDPKDLLIRTIEVPLIKREDILAALPFQAESFLPYPLESALLESQIISSEGARSSLVLFAVKKDHLISHLDSYHAIDIDPEAVSTTPVALAALFNTLNFSEEVQAVLYFGDFQSYLVLMKKGAVLACRSFDFGLYTFSAAFTTKNDTTRSGLEKFKTLNHLGLLEHFPEAHSLMETIYKELYKSIFAFNQKIPFETIHLLGEGAENTSWQELLTKKLEKEIVMTKASAALAISQDDLHRFAIPIGLAISYHSPLAINFRSGEFAYPKPLKRFKKPFLAYFSLVIALTCSLFFLNFAYQNNQLVQLKQEYLYLLASIGKSYDEAEDQFKKDHIPSKLLFELTQSELNTRVQKIQSYTLKEPNIFPLFPETPRVSDLLAWLSTHPQVIDGEKEGITPLKFDEIHYSMVKRPELSKKNEKYLVKVDLEFSVANPSIARAFHDALLAPNAFVDSKHEVEWTCYKNKYRASFYLKDLTRYY